MIDRFGDVDTRAFAVDLTVVDTLPDGTLDEPAVVAQVDRWRAVEPQSCVIWGGGIEAQPALLTALKARIEVLGAPLAAVRALHAPLALAETLRGLAVPWPEVANAPRRETGWLTKRIAAAGGWHVQPYAPGTPLRAGEYLQRRVDGETFSYSFVARGPSIDELGCNRMLNLQPTAAQPFRYGGAVASELPSPLRQLCRGVAERLSGYFGWRGLCGFDFVTDGATCQVIDLNPRPTATSHLAYTPASTLLAHVAACRDTPLSPLVPHDDVHGHLVCYAPDPIQIPNSLDWPGWTTDRPSVGTRVPAGAPLCSIHAAARNESATVALLSARLAALRQWLAASAGFSHPGHSA